MPTPEELSGLTPQDTTRRRDLWIRINDPVLRDTLGIPEEGMSQEDFWRNPNAPTAQALGAEQPRTPGFFTSVGRATQTTKADLAQTARLGLEFLEMPEAAEYFRRKAQEFQKAAEAYPRAIPGIEDIHNPGDFVTWALESLGEQVPTLATLIVPGTFGAKLTSQIPKVAAAVKAAQAPGATAKGLALAPEYAGRAAAFLADLGLMTGESVDVADETGGDIKDLRVIGSGLGKALLDFTSFFVMAKRLGIGKEMESRFLRAMTSKGYLKRVAGNASVIMATEVPTEVAQEIINNELDNYFTGYDGPITEEQKSALYNAAAGAALFGVLGFYAPRRTEAPPPIKEAEETGAAVEPSTVKDLTIAAQPGQTPFEILGLEHSQTFESVPTSDYSVPTEEGRVVFSGAGFESNVSGFDFRNLYDPRTGAIRTTTEDFMRIVQEQTQVKYDPVSDTVPLPPLSANYSVIIPGWKQVGVGYYLDAPSALPMKGRAKVVPTENGFAAYTQDEQLLGVYPSAESAMIGAQEQLDAKGEVYVFTPNGIEVRQSPQAHTKFVDDIKMQALVWPMENIYGTEDFPVPYSPVELASIYIEEATKQRQKDETVPTQEESAVIEAGDPEIQKMLEARDELLANKDNYRTSDGALKRDAERRLKALDERMARYKEAKGRGLAAEPTTVVDVKQGDVEAGLAETNNQEAQRADAPVFPNLTPFEAKEYVVLEEKLMYEGQLSPKEMDSFLRLKQKIETGQTRYGVYAQAEEIETPDGFDALVEKVEAMVESAKATARKLQRASKNRKKKKKSQPANRFGLDETPDAAKKAGQVIRKKPTRFSQGTLTNVWPVAQEWFNQNVAPRWTFTLDAAASPENAKAPRFFTEKDDGLKQSWAGETVWLNPPYNADSSNPKGLYAWMEKAYTESQRGATVVTLVPVRTDTKWWHEFALKGRIEFIKGRVPFDRVTELAGEGKNKAPFANALIIFGEQNLVPAQGEPTGFARGGPNSRAVSEGWYGIPEARVGDVMLVHDGKAAGVIYEKDSEGVPIYEAVRLHQGELHSIGWFDSLEEAAWAAEGQSTTFADNTREALSRLWRMFNIRPKLHILTTGEIIDNKIGMSPMVQKTLLESRGIFMQGKPGEVYIHIDAHGSVEETVKTLVHEMNGHFGLRAFLPDAEWRAYMLAYAKWNRERIKALETSPEGPGAISKAPVESPRGAAYRAIGEEQTADLISADEAISYLAEKKFNGETLNHFDQSFLDTVIALIRKWYRKFVLKVMPESWRQGLVELVPFNDKDVILLLRDTAKWMRTANPNTVVDTRRDYAPLISQAVKQNLLPPKNAELTQLSVDSLRSVWVGKAAGLFLQPLQYAERYNLPFVADFMETVQRWAARKSLLQSAPVELVTKWHEYNKSKGNNLGLALLEMDAESSKVNRELTETERLKILERFGITDKRGIDLANDIRQSFRKVVDMLELGLIKQELRRHVETREEVERLYKLYESDRKSNGTKSDFVEALAADLRTDVMGKLNEIHGQIQAMRNREYFPHMRFGKYAIWVKAKSDLHLDGKKYRGPFVDKNGDKHSGQIIHFETFETYREMNQAREKIAKEFSNVNAVLGTGEISDQEYVLMGMPPVLYDSLRKHLKLEKEQEERLKELYWASSPGARFMRSLINRRNVRGFSEDALRVYSSYMMNAAGHIARIENMQDMDEAIAKLHEQQKNSGSIIAGQVANYWTNHYDYIMRPENDWAGLRAMGFLWYLGLNAKSAFVNLTQVPMVAYPYLADRFGDAKAVAALTKAYQDGFKMARGQAIASTELAQALTQGVEQGFLNESLATTLAGFTENSVLERLAPGSGAQKRISDLMYYGSAMFHHVEQLNRYTTFIAAWKLSLEKQGNRLDQQTLARAFAEGKEAVQSTMFEYNKWNRAPYMRGRRSVVFLFWNYMQGMAYLLAGKKGKGTAMRMWMLLFLAAGLQGLPFMENILDIIDFGGTKAKEALGSKDPYMDSRLWLREAMMAISDNPDFLLHGWARNYGLGPAHLLELAGVPVPNVDISGSLSMGRWLPGTDKALNFERDPDKKLGRTLVDMLGPVAGIGYGFWQAMNSTDPDQWKVWERALPTALKMASQSARRAERGEESFRGGGAITTFDPTDWEDRTLLAMNMLGFQPSKVTGSYEVIGTKESLRRYWSLRQTQVMENIAWARRSGDPELIADANRAKDEFNSQAPDPKLRITPEKIRQSMKARAVKMKNRELGMPNEKAYRQLYEEIDRIYGLR